MVGANGSAGVNARGQPGVAAAPHMVVLNCRSYDSQQLNHDGSLRSLRQVCSKALATISSSGSIGSYPKNLNPCREGAC